MYGSRITLYIVLLVSVTVGPLGLLLGVSAGYFGGKVDMVLMRVTDIFISFRVWSCAGVCRRFRTGLEHVVIAITLTATAADCPSGARETLSAPLIYLRRASAGRFIGPRPLAPYRAAVSASVIIRITMNMAGIILTAAGLGFLGLGAAARAGVGAMISSGRTYMMECWWS